MFFFFLSFFSVATSFFFFFSRRSQDILISRHLQIIILYQASPASALELSWSFPIQMYGHETTGEILKSICNVFNW